jgi:starch phosphorylase
MKTAMKKLAPVFNTNRMVREYAERFYLTGSKRWEELTRDNLAAAKALAEWKRRMHEQFAQVRIESVNDNMDGVSRVGRSVRVEATVMLGGISPQDVSVQMYHGPLDADGQLSRGQALEMQPADAADGGGRMRYAAEMPCDRTGLAGYTVRILPRHSSLPDAREMGLIRWA